MSGPWYLRAWLAVWHAPGRTWAGMMAAGPLATWLTAGAAVAWTLVTVGLVGVFRDRLTSDHAFWIIMAAHSLVGVAILALTGREISANVSRSGLNVNLGRDADDDELPPDQRVQR